MMFISGFSEKENRPSPYVFCAASNCQTAAAAIVVCIAARVFNKMPMMTTVV